MNIICDKMNLHCELDMPAGDPEKCPLVILIHGFTGHSEEPHIIAVSKAINETGAAVLRVDMYGHGKSDGTFREHTLFKWMTNAMTVIDHAGKLPFVTDLYLCGHSQGGLTVMLAAAMKHEVIRGIIPMSPAIMIPEMARKGDLLGIAFDPDNIPEQLILENGNELNGNYIRAAQMIRVEDAIARYTGPVLLIHGDADDVVPYHYSEEAAGAYRNAQLVRIPDDNHHYDQHLDMVLDAVRGWLTDQSSEFGV